MFILFLLSVLSATLVSAEPSLNYATFTWNGQPITTISPQFPVVSYLEFAIQSEELIDTITVDASQINSNPTYQNNYRNIDVSVQSCAYGNNEYVCFIPNLIIQTTQDVVQIDFAIETQSGLTQTQSSYTFTIDDTSPQVTFLGSEYCHEDDCYIPSNKLTKLHIEMEDSIATFHKQRVALSLGEGPIPVFSCDGLSCFANGKKTCFDKSNVKLSVASFNGWPSSDDAGNPLKGILETDLICDATPPTINTESFTYQSLSGLPSTTEGDDIPFGHLGDELTISFQASDATSPTLKAVADISAVSTEDPLESECVKVGNYTPAYPFWDCSVNIPLTPENIGLITIPLSVVDIAQNKDEYDLKINVLAPDDDVVPDHWTAKQIDPLRANKHYLQYTPKKLFIEVNLESRSQAYELIDVQLGECSAFNDGGSDQGSEGDLNDPTLISVNGKSVLVTYILRQGPHYNEFDSVKYDCNLLLLSKTGNAINTKQETETFTIEVDFHSTITMGEAVQDEIKEVMEKYQAETEKLLQQKKSLNLLTNICKLPPSLKSIGGFASGIGGGLMAFPPTFSVGETLHENVGKPINSKAETKQLSEVCSLLTCDGEINNQIGNAVNTALIGIPDALSQFGASSYADSLDPYNSHIAAIMKLCYPAHLYHKERDLALQCQYAACLANEAVTGFTDAIDACQSARNYGQCRYHYGGIFNAIPLANVVKQSQQIIVETVSNPVSLFTTLGSVLACKTFHGSKIPDAACHAKVGIEGAISAIESFEQIRKQLDLLLAGSVQAQDSCTELLNTVDPQTGYLNYVDKPNEFELKKTYGVEGDGEYGVTFNNLNYPMTCNEFTGCSVKVAKSKSQREFTFIPASDTEVLVYLGARRIDPAIFNDPKANEKKIKALGLDHQYLDADNYPTDSLKELLGMDGKPSEAKAHALKYRSNLLEQYQDDPEAVAVINAYNEFIGDHTAALDELGSAQKEYDAAFQHYSNTNELEKNALKLGENNDAFKKFVETRFATAWQTMSDADKAKFTGITDPTKATFADFAGVSGHETFAQIVTRYDAKFEIDYNRFANTDSELRDKIYAVATNHPPGTNPSITQTELQNIVGSHNVLTSKDDIKWVLEDENFQEKLENDKQDAKENSDKKAKIKRDKEVELQKAQKKLELELHYQLNYKGFFQAFRSTLRFARTINTVGPQMTSFIGSVFGKDDLYESWKGKVVDILGENKFVYGDWEGAVCEADHLGVREGEFQTLVTRQESGVFANTARIEGIRITQGFSSEEFRYIINAYVANTDEDTPLSFDIILKEGSAEKILVQGQILAKGEDFTKSKQNALEHTSDVIYDEVCIKFHSDRLYRWFENAEVGQELCRVLVDD